MTTYEQQMDDYFRREAEKAALEKSRKAKNFNVIPWRRVVAKQRPHAMAAAIREYSHQGIIIMDQMFFDNPAHIVQIIRENEQLALRVESCPNEAAALAEIKTFTGKTSF
jgi:glutamate synthase domain-containing protein 1